MASGGLSSRTRTVNGRLARFVACAWITCSPSSTATRAVSPGWSRKTSIPSTRTLIRASAAVPPQGRLNSISVRTHGERLEGGPGLVVTYRNRRLDRCVATGRHSMPPASALGALARSAEVPFCAPQSDRPSGPVGRVGDGWIISAASGTGYAPFGRPACAWWLTTHMGRPGAVHHHQQRGRGVPLHPSGSGHRSVQDGAHPRPRRLPTERRPALQLRGLELHSQWVAVRAFPDLRGQRVKAPHGPYG